MISRGPDTCAATAGVVNGKPSSRLSLRACSNDADGARLFMTREDSRAEPNQRKSHPGVRDSRSWRKVEPEDRMAATDVSQSSIGRGLPPMYASCQQPRITPTHMRFDDTRPPPTEISVAAGRTRRDAPSAACEPRSELPGGCDALVSRATQGKRAEPECLRRHDTSTHRDVILRLLLATAGKIHVHRHFAGIAGKCPLVPTNSVALRPSPP